MSGNQHQPGVFVNGQKVAESLHDYTNKHPLFKAEGGKVNAPFGVYVNDGADLTAGNLGGDINRGMLVYRNQGNALQEFRCAAGQEDAALKAFKAAIQADHPDLTEEALARFERWYSQDWQYVAFGMPARIYTDTPEAQVKISQAQLYVENGKIFMEATAATPLLKVGAMDPNLHPASFTSKLTFDFSTEPPFETLKVELTGDNIPESDSVNNTIDFTVPAFSDSDGLAGHLIDFIKEQPTDDLKAQALERVFSIFSDAETVRETYSFLADTDLDIFCYSIFCSQASFIKQSNTSRLERVKGFFDKEVKLLQALYNNNDAVFNLASVVKDKVPVNILGQKFDCSSCIVGITNFYDFGNKNFVIANTREAIKQHIISILDDDQNLEKLSARDILDLGRWLEDDMAGNNVFALKKNEVSTWRERNFGGPFTQAVKPNGKIKTRIVMNDLTHLMQKGRERLSRLARVAREKAAKQQKGPIKNNLSVFGMRHQARNYTRRRVVTALAFGLAAAAMFVALPYILSATLGVGLGIVAAKLGAALYGVCVGSIVTTTGAVVATGTALAFEASDRKIPKAPPVQEDFPAKK